MSELRVEVEGPVAILVVDRPEKRNALNAAVRAAIVAALDELRDRPDVRVIVITGAGDRAFIAGADVAEFAARTPPEQRQAMAARSVFDAIASCPKPTIAMINGYALGGGCEIALACDIRIAARSARLGQPEILLGLIPGGGGTQRLPRLIGPGRALRMILTGELIEATEAERIGLVDAVVEDASLRETVLGEAKKIAAHSPRALELAKRAVRASLDLPLAQGLPREREWFIEAFASEDGREGVRAFLEKRPPQFRND